MHVGSGFRTGGPLLQALHRGLRGGLVLLLSALLPIQAVGFAAAAGKGTTSPGQSAAVSRWPAGSRGGAAAKIDSAVTQAFATSARVRYFVKLRTQADVKGAAASARNAVEPALKEVAARGAVMQALQQTAEESQRSLVHDLEAERAKGTVTQFESYWVNNLIAVTSSRDAMERMASRSDVAKIIANAPIHLAGPVKGSTPAQTKVTPAAATAPGATVAPASVEWGVQRIGAPSVWSQYGIDGTGSVVASLDTGVDWTHPALHDRWRGYDPSTGATDPTYSWFDAVNARTIPYDDHGHGTHTTGTAVGRDPAGSDQIGVAPGARWIAAKILDAGGSGSSENIIRAGQWLLAPGGDASKAPDVVNNSWGGGPGVDEWFREIVQAWRAAGIVPAFANGNDGPGDGTASEPGNYPESFAVGAIDSHDAVADFSSRGPSPYGEIKPEVAAPGVDIRSSVPGGGYEGGWSGTSMATPHVTGAVALLRQANAALTVDQIEELLINSAEPKTDSRYPSVPNNGYGNGILNVYNAVGMIVSGIGTVSGRVVTGGDDFEPPTVRHTPVTEGFKREPIDVTAEVADNVSVTNVRLRFRMPGMTWWGIVEMARTSGDFKAGTYAGTIPPDMTQGDRVEYYIEAQDYGGNNAYAGTAAHPYAVPLLNGITAGYRQDFEGSATGWNHGGTADSWQIGVPTSGPGNAHSGQRVAATNLSGDYQDNSASWLMAPPIDLTSGAAALRFWQWYDFEEGYDVGAVLASADGGATWDTLRQYTGLNGAWQQQSVSLASYAGNPRVYVAFFLGSDPSVPHPGWYLDDVELFRGTEPPPAPTNLRAAPTGTGTVALTWDAVSAPELSRYRLYRSTTSGSGYTRLADPEDVSYIDAATVAGATYYYVATAIDIFGNESAMSAEASATIGSVEVRFHDDMEAGNGSWTHAGTRDPWQHGTPTAGPAAANSGVSLWGTNLAGNYDNNTNAQLVTPSINLTGLSSAALQFAHWYSLEQGYDFGFIEIASDGGTWTELARYSSPGSGGQPVGWEQPLISLNAYVGHQVQIRFRLRTDGSVVFPGWYIDDVTVAGTTTGGTSLNLPLTRNVADLSGSTKAKPTYNPHPTVRQAPATTPATTPATSPANRKPGSAVVTTGGIGIQSLPLDATVTVVETGRVVRTNPADGSFRITLPAGTYTLRAQTYGYFPLERSATVADGGDVNVIFQLQPIPHGTITGTVTDSRSGSPIQGASVSVAEDPHIAAVTTDANGHYTIDVLQGAYTLQARRTGYYPASGSADVGANASVTVDFALRPFIGMPGEIFYDDGSAENAWGYFAAGNGWGVRMSPLPGQPVVITGARFFLWDTSWPTPGGNSFQAAIYRANPDGSPGSLLAGPITINNAVRGDWNNVDLSGYGITVTGDFIVAYIQSQPNPNMPGMAVDESTPSTHRNYQLISGSWSPWTDSSNFMIRAQVSYAVGSPVITAPADGSFTNQAQAHVTGTASAGTTVNLSRDGAEVSQVPATGGSWAADITLNEGPNRLTATATVPGSGPGSGTTDPSAPITVTLDTVAPVMALSTPADGSIQRSRILQVAGTVTEAHLAGVRVNGQAATVDGTGRFAAELIGQEGANTLTVVAADRAGNETRVVRTVQVDTAAPAITGMQPATDQNLQTGSRITVVFDSEHGLALAGYQIVVSPTGSGITRGGVKALTLEPGEAAMQEVTPGHYQAEWTVPAGYAATLAYVRFRAVDQAGNETRATAPGVLRFTNNQAPTAVITGPTTGRINQQLRLDGTRSNDRDGRIVNYAWNFGDGTTGSGSVVQHRFTRAGTYTVTLTVTDNQGATATATTTITIRR